MPEIVRFVVEAVEKKPVPLTLSAVEEAPPFMENRPLVMVELALEMKPLDSVPSPPSVAAPEVCSVPFEVLRTPTPRPPVKYVLCATIPFATKLCVPETAMSQTCSTPSYSIATMRSNVMSSRGEKRLERESKTVW